MSSYRYHKKKLMADINVVPYIDVMLVLLVIFMITAPLLAQGIKVDLPKVEAKPITMDDSETLIVSIDRKGKYYLDDAPMALQAIQSKVSKILQQRPKTPVVVRGDHQVEYGRVVKLMQAMQSAGAPSVGLATAPPPQR